MSDNVYLGNPNLKRANVQIEFTPEQIQEYARCMEDPAYFIENYIKIVSIDEGLVPFTLSFSKRYGANLHTNHFSICKLPRQSGKSTTIISYLLITVCSIFSQCCDSCKQEGCKRPLRKTTRIRASTKVVATRGYVLEQGSLELENGSRFLQVQHPQVQFEVVLTTSFS